jgi:multidrug efflux pump subunit AcrA (membrane-fusion protein)
MMVKSAKFMVEYAEEELAQLKKMYKANDLTEETEKMVLRRQKHWVERATFWHEMAVLDRDYTVKISLPEREKTLREAQAKNELQWDKTRKTTALQLTHKKASLAKMHDEFDKNASRLDKLHKDRAAMILRAPMDGIVYHGRFHQGQWSATESLATKLAPRGTIAPDGVFMTIVKPRPAVVYVNVDEKEVHLLKTGAAGTVKLTCRPDRKLAARVIKLAAAPSLPGKFAAQIQLDFGAGDDDLVPGMACSIKFVPYTKKSAIVIAFKYLHEEDGHEVVFVTHANGKHEMRTITRGRSHGDDVEIVTGLSDGEEILLERPVAKSAKGGTP